MEYNLLNHSIVYLKQYFIVSQLYDSKKNNEIYMIYFTFTFPFSSAFPFFMWTWVSNLYYFLSLWRINFNISCKKILLVKSFHNSLFFWGNVFILKDSFIGYWILGWWFDFFVFFFFQHFKASLHSFLIA